MVWELGVMHLIRCYEPCVMHLTAFCHLWIIKSCVQPVVIAGVVKKIVCVLLHLLGHSLGLILA